MDKNKYKIQKYPEKGYKNLKLCQQGILRNQL